MMVEKPLVSVIIPTYHRSEYIQRAVMSVFEQTYSNIEVIVVDDNGLGNQEQKRTQDVICEIQNNYAIQYIPHAQNSGGCVARNTGFFHSNGEFIAFLDDDDQWLPTFIEELLGMMKDSSVGVVYTRVYLKENNHYYIENKNVQLKNGNIYKDIIKGWCGASTSLVLLRKKYVQMVNGFDENLASFQDYDLWVRLSKVCKFEFVNKYLAIKEDGHSTDQVAFNPERRERGLNSLVNKMEKTLSEEEYLSFLPFVELWRKEIAYNRIAIAKIKQSGNLIQLFHDYCHLEKRFYKRFLALVTIIFGYKFASKMKKSVLLLSGRLRKVKMDNV